jgi:endonuclease YncB( thermonuclease family)
MKRLAAVVVVALCLGGGALAKPMAGTALRIAQSVISEVNARAFTCPDSMILNGNSGYVCALASKNSSSTIRRAIDAAAQAAAAKWGARLVPAIEWTYSTGFLSYRTYSLDGVFYMIWYDGESGGLFFELDEGAEPVTSEPTTSNQTTAQPSGQSASTVSRLPAGPILPHASNITPAQEYPLAGFRVLNGISFVAELPSRQTEVVSLIGVGQPSVAEDEQAAAFLNRVLGAKRVVMQTDAVARQNGFMAVYVVADGVLVNAELIRAGLVTFVPDPNNNAHDAELKAAEDEAKAAGRGIWKK